jgi:hypothetical protein
MEEFVLPVIINGKERDFNARLIHLVYSYKIEVDVDDTKVHFERGDGGEWRALLTEEDLSKNINVNKETVMAFVQCIE